MCVVFLSGRFQSHWFMWGPDVCSVHLLSATIISNTVYIYIYMYVLYSPLIKALWAADICISSACFRFFLLPTTYNPSICWPQCSEIPMRWALSRGRFKKERICPGFCPSYFNAARCHRFLALLQVIVCITFFCTLATCKCCPVSRQ